MSDYSRLTPAGIRRLLALRPDGGRQVLRRMLAQPEIAGPLPLERVHRVLRDYLLDPRGGPIVASDPKVEAWIDRSLVVRRLVPGNALPVSDEVAAVLAGPALVENGPGGDRVAEETMASRFASRADEALAAAVALLPAEAAVAAVLRLAAEPGPDEANLHLALLQAGRALAWTPSLSERGEAAGLVDRLLALLDRRSPGPLLEQLVPVLGPLAAAPGPPGERVRAGVLERLAAFARAVGGRRSGDSFLAEFQALDRPRSIPDEDHYLTLPDRQAAEAAAEILGRAARGLDRGGFAQVRSAVLDGPVAGALGDSLLPSFLQGLVDGAAVEPLAELSALWLASGDEELVVLALRLASQLPLDACAEACLGCLEDGRASVREAAVRAVVLLEPELAIPALSLRLGDPAPEVCARAARALVELGQREPVERRTMPVTIAVGRSRERTAAVRAALPDPSPEVGAALLLAVAAEAEADDEDLDGSALVEALASLLRTTEEGIRLAARLIEELPDALPFVVLALAGSGGGEEAEVPSVALPAVLRAELRRVLDPLIDAGGEAGMLALTALARLSLGDAELVGRIVEAGRRTEGYEQQVLMALSDVRVRSELAAPVLAPLLEDEEHLGARLLATAAAGVVLPRDDPRWSRVRELLDLGTVAAAASHAALVNAARVRG